ncbi:MAG: hypothetical protein H6597_04390 [Flavobacteriales bacterium]|nr:hypothetical protein [Flavobacteriales bacterium]
MLPRPRGPLTVLLLRLLVLALLYSAQRLCFFLFNPASFPDAPFLAFVGGVRFDLSAIAWLNLPWVLLYLVAPARRRLGRPEGRFLVVSSIGFAFKLARTSGTSGSTLKRSGGPALDHAGGDTANLMRRSCATTVHIALIFWWPCCWPGGILVGRFLRDQARLP